MNHNEYKKEQQKIYDSLINACIGKRVVNTEYYGENGTAYYENDVKVSVCDVIHIFYIGIEAKTFHSERITLDQDYQEFVLETAKIEEEKRQALRKVEDELRARKGRVQRIEEMQKFVEKFKAT